MMSSLTGIESEEMDDVPVIKGYQKSLSSMIWPDQRGLNAAEKGYLFCAGSKWRNRLTPVAPPGNHGDCQEQEIRGIDRNIR